MDKKIEIEQDEEFQRKTWVFERVGMYFIILFLLAALTGFLGSGPASYKKASGEELDIEYPMLVRFSHPEDIKVTLGDIKTDTVKLLVNRDYISSINIERIIPEPVDQTFYKNYIQFSFISEKAPDKDIIFNVQFRKGGLLKGEWGIRGKRILNITHFVFP